MNSKASFVVTSAVETPEKIEQLLGMAPSKVIRKGDHVEDRSLDQHPFHFYMIHSQNQAEDRLEDHIAGLMREISSIREKIKRLPRSCKVGFFCRHDAEGYSGWTLSPALLNEMSTWNCEWVFGVEIKQK